MQPSVVPTLLAALAFAGVLGAVDLTPGVPKGTPRLVAVFPEANVDPAAPGAMLALDGSKLVQLPVTGPGPNATLAPPGPRFGHAGADAAVLTFYAFTADGRLLASDAAPEEFGRFTRHREFRHLEPAPWHLGEGSAPNGTVALPKALASLTPALRAALAGQPEGGVVTVRIDHGLIAAAYGPLTVAARVEKLVQAA
ncbi:MAG TPA: hypothetical protein VM241_06025 [Candidatus Thermoplasmatota archaeon]|nr:hypothetical protein [Candidatus Thermoplasmatota archaeon]